MNSASITQHEFNKLTLNRVAIAISDSCLNRVNRLPISNLIVNDDEHVTRNNLCSRNISDKGGINRFTHLIDPRIDREAPCQGMRQGRRRRTIAACRYRVWCNVHATVRSEVDHRAVDRVTVCIRH